MENNMPKKPGLFARLFGKGWNEAVQEIEAISAKLDKEKNALDQREAALVKRENELARKESELNKRKNELNKREARIKEQEKKSKRKERLKEKSQSKGLERLEIQAKAQVEVFAGPKVEKLISKDENREAPAKVAVEVVSKPTVETIVEPEIIEEPKVEEKLEIVEDLKEDEKLEIIEESKAEEKAEVVEESEVEEKLEVVEEPKEEEKLEIVEEPKVEEKVEIVEEPKAKEKLEILEEPKAEEKLEIVEEPKVEEKLEVVEQPKVEKTKTESKPKEKNKPQKVAQYSEELNEKRNTAILEALKELNAEMERQLKLDDIQAATAKSRTPEADITIKKRRTATVATIRGYLFGLIAGYLDTLPEGDLKHIKIEGMTSIEFLRFLASDYEFDFERSENNTKSLAIAKNGNFASKRFIYGTMRGYGKITNSVIEKEKYANEIISLANNWLIGSYLDETLDETAPNMRKGIKIETQKIAKRDQDLEKELGDAGLVL
jgi:hypothetical protein